jgi:hypothetical protein
MPDFISGSTSGDAVFVKFPMPSNVTVGPEQAVAFREVAEAADDRPRTATVAPLASTAITAKRTERRLVIKLRIP